MNQPGFINSVTLVMIHDDDDDDDEDDVLVRISSPKLLLSMLLHGTLSEVPSGIEFPCQTEASIRAFGARLPFWPTSLERPGGSGLWLFCLGERGSDGLRGPLPRCLRSPLVPLRGLVSFLARNIRKLRKPVEHLAFLFNIAN